MICFLPSETAYNIIEHLALFTLTNHLEFVCVCVCICVHVDIFPYVFTCMYQSVVLKL